MEALKLEVEYCTYADMLEWETKPGVREYWVIDPDAKMVQVFSLVNDQYVTTGYGIEDKALEAGVLPGCTIDLEALFAAAEA
jgi:Uma2 family endonuclease